MINDFKKLFALLDRRERRLSMALFVLMVLSALLETLGVASITPFVAVLSDADALMSIPFAAEIYGQFGFTDHSQFMLLVGLMVFFLFATSLAVKALNLYAILRFANTRAHIFSTRLLRGYLSRPYEYFLTRNTADMNKTVFSEVNEVINGAMIPALRLLSSTVLAIFVSGLLLFVNPILTVVVGVVLGSSFAIIYVSSRRLLTRLGEQRVADNSARFVLVNEALNGIKELRLAGRERGYFDRFSAVSQRFWRQLSASKVIGDLPHLAIQAVAFGGIVLLVIYLSSQAGGLQGALPLVALYAFAGYRLLPAFQEIFKNSTQLRYYRPALQSLDADLSGAPSANWGDDQDRSILDGDVKIDRIEFRFEGATRAAINDLSLKIERGSSVAFVGTTGAGKSTLADLIMGLLRPQSGTISVGGQVLTTDNLRLWQNNIGYVPQTIFLADASILENIAFGVPRHHIDQDAVERAARAAHISDFITGQLPEGYLTEVGERGVRLSGGQRQRLGIARALYHDPNVVVFDEATSALDNHTESAVMEAVSDLAGEKTVILIAHRLSTVKRCDRIFMLEDGCLITEGRYDELQATDAFRRLASGEA
jgi:ABC-type bacteriocin/lantibiotic exporter with double-glycine peptidase domain